MRRCILNDCTGFKSIALCCLDCPERTICPDRCQKSETTFCVGLIEENDDKDKSRTIKTESAIH